MFYTGKRRPGGGRKRKLSDLGRENVFMEAEGSNSRKVAKKTKFQSRSGAMVKICPNTVTNMVKSELVLSVPKIRGIRVHFDHHRRMRIEHAL